ncbi:MAG: hypothetical protein LBE80_08135 [Deltaproteobacteria bacterium]|jgi:hypothetical protein|nr:hypothetical protein [Deltaproteobacteria bacterium]
MKRLRPIDPKTYLEDCLALANTVLADYRSPAEVLEAKDEINAYPGLKSLIDPQSIRVLEPMPSLKDLGLRSLLDGLILWEHPAAGEATRLGLGPKFFLRPRDLAEIIGQVEAWAHLKPISLGLRHLLEPLAEIINLAEQYGLDPQKVIKKQTFLLIGAADHLEAMRREAVSALSKVMPLENIWLMAQSSFHGLNKSPGQKWAFDPSSPKRLHNHGHMIMQKTMDNQIYRLDDSGQAHYFSRQEFFHRLANFVDLISNNIEDLDYLNKAIEEYALGLAVRLGRSGFGMMMEITLNNQHNPIKGGMCAHDPSLARDVVIESFNLKNVLPRDIKFLNANMNHYLNPVQVLTQLQESGLPMPVTVQDDRLYFTPVQGDLNFLVKTAFFTRHQDKQLNSLKYPSDIPSALSAMALQDQNPRFMALVDKALG